MKARNSSGTFSYKKETISQKHVREFLESIDYRICEALEEDNDFEGYFFHIHAKGEKVRMHSSLESNEDPLEKLLLVYNPINWLILDNVYADFAVELNPTPGFHLHWSIDFGAAYLKSLGLSSIVKYPNILGTDFGGITGVGNSKSPIIFAQMYSKDKTRLYSYGESGFSNFSIQDVKNGSTRYLNMINTCKASFREECNPGYKYGVRLEVRCLIKYYPSVKNHFSADSMARFLELNENMFYAIPNKIAGDLKFSIIYALNHVMERSRNVLIPETLLSLAYFVTFYLQSLFRSVHNMKTAHLGVTAGRKLHNLYTTDIIDMKTLKPKREVEDYFKFAEDVSKTVRYRKPKGSSRNREIPDPNYRAFKANLNADLVGPKDANRFIALWTESVIDAVPNAGNMLSYIPSFDRKAWDIKSVARWVAALYFKPSKKAIEDVFSLYFPKDDQSII